MRKLLLLLALLPSVALGATNYWVGPNNGLASTAANWSLGYIPTNSADVMMFTATGGSNTTCYANINNTQLSACIIESDFTASVIASNVAWRPVSLDQRGGTTTSSGSGKWQLWTAVSSTPWLLTGGKCSNTEFRIDGTPSGTLDISSRLSNGYLTNVLITLTTSSLDLVATNCPLNGCGVDFNAVSKSLLLSNVSGSTLRSLSISGANCSGGSSIVRDSTFSCAGLLASTSGARTQTALVSNCVITVVAGGQFTMQPNISSLSFVVSDCTVSFQNTSTSLGFILSSLSPGTNVSITVSNTQATTFPFNPGTMYVKSLSVNSGTIGMQAATTYNTVSVGGGTFLSNGYAVTANAATITGGTVIASNSTITATTITQSGGTFSNMTSTVRLAGSSNLTNYYNLASIGAASVTGAVSCTGTLYSEGSSYSINGNGGTLTLTAPSYFNGIVSNATIGAGAPLTAERSQGVGGQINDIQRMGAE